MKYLFAQPLFSELTCDSLIEAYAGADWRVSTLGTRENIENLSNADIRRCQVTPCKSTFILEAIAERASILIPQTELYFNKDDLPFFTAYSVGDFFDWHIDIGQNEGAAKGRWLSFSLQLSSPDSYRGGDLEFGTKIQSTQKDYLRQQGNVIFFPADAVHRVSKISQGVRFALVGWLHMDSITQPVPK